MLGRKQGGACMFTVKDLVEDWIEMRSMLIRQSEMLESGEMHIGADIPDATTRATIAQIEKWISELNALLKEYARA
jgi:hypothetical protein